MPTYWLSDSPLHVEDADRRRMEAEQARGPRLLSAAFALLLLEATCIIGAACYAYGYEDDLAAARTAAVVRQMEGR